MAPAIQTLILLTLTAILQAEELLLKQKCGKSHLELKRAGRSCFEAESGRYRNHCLGD
jgi:hypothetical protein